MNMKLFHTLIAASMILFGSAHAASPSDSIYQLNSQLTDQSAKPIGLNVYAGHPVLVSMFYADCPNACPLLIEAIRATEAALPAKQRDQLRVLLISLDAENDTPESLNALATQRHVDLKRWSLAHGDETTIRRIAAVLHIQYRKLPDGGFNHSSVITLLDKNGAIVKQTSLLAKADPEMVASVGAAFDKD
jgi:protein SCO1/2